MNQQHSGEHRLITKRRIEMGIDVSVEAVMGLIDIRTAADPPAPGAFDVSS